jgi:hypothetical protein
MYIAEGLYETRIQRLVQDSIEVVCKIMGCDHRQIKAEVGD